MPAAARTLLFRLPRSAYLVVLFLIFCCLPIALADSGGDEGGPIGPTWRLVVFVLPLAAIGYIGRTATLVGPEGIRVRAILGSRTMRWDDIRGLSVTGRAVYAVLARGAIRLPNVRTNDLSAISKVSGGRLPELREPVVKVPPGRTRRRPVRRAAEPSDAAPSDAVPLDADTPTAVEPAAVEPTGDDAR